jgi:hypothetical protein
VAKRPRDIEVEIVRRHLPSVRQLLSAHLWLAKSARMTRHRIWATSPCQPCRAWMASGSGAAKAIGRRFRPTQRCWWATPFCDRRRMSGWCAARWSGRPLVIAWAQRPFRPATWPPPRQAGAPCLRRPCAQSVQCAPSEHMANVHGVSILKVGTCARREHVSAVNV